MLKYFRPRVRTRHPSHKHLRPQYKKLPLFPFRSIIRLGSFTELKPNKINKSRVEINTVEAISNSADKLKMKQCFTQENVKTADWSYKGDDTDMFWLHKYGEEPALYIKEAWLDQLEFPVVSKHIRGSRGTGNKKHDTVEELETWMNGKDLSNYIFEKYYSYNREYRLHVDEEGCFYTCRKMLKSDAPQEVRWYRNDDHCVWILEENELFDKPSNWDDVVSESVKALKAVGLDFGAIDLRIQSATMRDGETPRENPEFIVVEINSAPSFGGLTEEAYLRELPRIIKNKYNKLNQ
jgi:hypothetical protein